MEEKSQNKIICTHRRCEDEYTLDQVIEEIATTVGIAKAVRRFFFFLVTLPHTR